MYVRRVELENIRSLKQLVWELPVNQGSAGWHVILGDNGSGKTSFLRGVAICLLSMDDFPRAVQAEWRMMRNNADFMLAKIKVSLDLSHDYFSDVIQDLEDDNWNISTGEYDIVRRISRDNKSNKYSHYVVFNGGFSSSFGNSRKFKTDYNLSGSVDLSIINPDLHRHFSLFDDSYLFASAIPWLQLLKFEELEGERKIGFLSGVLDFINQSGFLANDAKIVSVTSKEILVRDGAGNLTKIEEVSDGYRSMFSLCVELLRQLTLTFGHEIFDPQDPSKVIAPGVVQIDEVDAHLHPEWQHRVGQWFKDHFPNLQFIVTTHSPIVCWAADSVFVLPKPGSDDEARFLTKEELNRVKFGSIQEAYMLDAFGEIDRSEEGHQKLARLSELNNKEWDAEQLTTEEREELKMLRSSLPLSALRMKN